MKTALLDQLRDYGYQKIDRGNWFYIVSSQFADSLPRIDDWVSSARNEFHQEKVGRGHRHFLREGPDGTSEWFIKQYHHGGLLAGEEDVSYDEPDRFINELLAYAKLEKSDVKVPKPIGIGVRRQGGQYEGFFFSRALNNPDEFTSQLRDSTDGELARAAGSCLAKIHQNEIDHLDYHVNNLLIDANGRVIPVDFDPVRFREPGVLRREMRLQRFRRSLRKYGFNYEDEKKFLDGYRSQTGQKHSVTHRMLSPFYRLKGFLSDIQYNLSGRSLESVDLEKILIRAPNWLGDAVMSLSVIQHISQQLPDSNVQVVCRGKVAPVYRAHDSVDRVHELRNSKEWNYPESITNERFSCVLTIPKSFRTGFQSFLSGIPRRIGFNTQFRTIFLTDPVDLGELDRTMHHAKLNYLLTSQFLDVPDQIPDPEIDLSDTNSTLKAFGLANGSYVVFHPGSAYGKAKRWPPERFGNLLSRITNRTGYDLVAVGLESESEIADNVISNISQAEVINLVGETSLRELMNVLSGANCTVANDSGVMHLSASLGVPTIGIFGSSDPSLTRPLGKRTEFVYEDVECSPCFERECPLDEDRYKCLTKIDVDSVFKTFQSLDQRQKSERA